MPVSGRFENKRAVVTGGASGIGRATAVRLAAEGARVLVGDVDEAGGRALADAHASGGGGGGTIAFRRCDVTAEDDIAALIEAADGVDLLFNNAGAGGAREPIGEIASADWDRTMALLLRSVALGIRYAAPVMQARGGGAIVNTSSVSALGSGYAPTAYSTAKAGVLHLTRMAAADLSQHGVRVNAVVPGFITTNIFTRHLDIPDERRALANAAIEQAAVGAQPVRRAGRAEDVAAAVCFLLSEDAGFVTGTHLVVDGGMTVGTRASWDPETPRLFAALEQFR